MFETNPRRELRFAGAAKIRGLRPIHDRLLVRIEPTPSPSETLVMLATTPETEQRRVRRGTVVARGAGDGMGRLCQVGVGDVVVFPPGCGQGLRLRLNGQEHVLVRERDVLAVIDDSATEQAQRSLEA